MFRKFAELKNRKIAKLFKSKRAQNTAEYALMISLVVAAVIAMQQYAQRAIQARIRDAANYMAVNSGLGAKTIQYEPYYLQRSYDSTSESQETAFLRGNGVAGSAGSTNRTRG